MEKFTEQAIRTLTDWFPFLDADPNFEITSNPTPAYNCIGWALGMDDVWVGLDHPTHYEWTWWPKDVPCDELSSSLVALFEYFGFEQCTNSDCEQGYDKVALYANDEGWTHAAKIIGDNIYHSKIGTAWDIHHSGGNTLEGTEYGHIFTYMKRATAQRFITDIKRPLPGTIKINI